MVNFGPLIKFILILNLINSLLAQNCSSIEESKFKPLDLNTPFKFETSPKKEVCLVYNLSSNKKEVGISFLKGNSYTVMIFIYDSYETIRNDKGNYTSSKDSLVIGTEYFKKVNVSDFDKKMYLVIKEIKSYYYSDYIKIYDSSIALEMKVNTPISIKYFMSNKEYNFVFKADKDIVIAYSSKVKGKKNVLIEKNEDLIFNSSDNNDIILTSESDNINYEYKINIKLYSNEEDINQDFNIMFYEKLENFLQIKENQTEIINYLSNDIKEQIFSFYIKIEKSFDLSYTINFKLDYNAYYTKYIEIITNQASSLPDLKNYQFNNNELQSTYDRDSDENLRFYFKPEESKPFILIKVQINKIDDYKIPNYFKISYSGPVEKYIIKSTSYKLAKHTFAPFYVNFYIDDSKNYLFHAPYEDYCLLLFGDIFDNNEINKNYIEEQTDLHEISPNSKSFTAQIFSSNKEINFVFEEYNPKDVLILEQKDRIKIPFSIKYEQADCSGTNKYIIFKYDIEYYSIGQNNFSNYWTTDGDMNIYYKNSLNDSEREFFPSESEKNQIEKEILYDSRTHLDIFTIKCKSPGTLFIRPLKKEFKETTHIITDNSITSTETFLGTEIIQLYSQIKNAPPHVYFSILTFSENEIIIEPDTPGLFNESIIDNKTKLFSLEIDTKLYKMDQMAIKLTSKSYNDLEIIETTDCNYCKYQKISNEIGQKDLEINSNNFVMFLEEKITNFSIIFNSLENEEVAYGIVDLASDNINYIPLAYNFPKIKREKLGKTLNITVESEFKKDEYKPFKAFIFSLTKNEVPKYKIDITTISDDTSNEDLFSLILIICLGTALLIAIVTIIILFIFKKKLKPINMDDFDNNEGLGN